MNKTKGEQSRNTLARIVSSWAGPVLTAGIGVVLGFSLGASSATKRHQAATSNQPHTQVIHDGVEDTRITVATENGKVLQAVQEMEHIRAVVWYQGRHAVADFGARPTSDKIQFRIADAPAVAESSAHGSDAYGGAKFTVKGLHFVPDHYALTNYAANLFTMPTNLNNVQIWIEQDSKP